MDTNEALHPDRQQGAEYLRLVLVGAAIGIPAALLAFGFLSLVHVLERLLWTDLPAWLGTDGVPWYLTVGLPVAGAALVVAARWLLPGDGGHSPLGGMVGGATPVAWVPGIALAAIGTLAFGAILGPEGPLIALGSAVGMAATKFVRVEGRGAEVLATAGSFSAISALFGGPLVAGFLMLEGGIAAGAALLPLLIPGLVAAAVGYVLFVGLGSWSGIPTAAMAVPDLPIYDGTRIIDLLLAIVVGVLLALLMSQVKRLGGALDRFAGRSARTGIAAVLAGGLVVGVLAQLAQLAGADSEQILFSGQSALPETLAETSITVLLVIIAAKAIGYGVCLGCGFRGGPVFPAILLGVALSIIMCQLFGMSITWALAVGAAAGMTSASGMVFSALVFSALLTGSAGVDAVPAAVLATVAAWLTGAALKRRQAPSGQDADGHGSGGQDADGQGAR